MFRKAVFAATVSMATLLAGAYAAVEPYLTPRQEVTLAAGVVVAVGMPTFAMWVYWWVNASVFGIEGRRPRQA